MRIILNFLAIECLHFYFFCVEFKFPNTKHAYLLSLLNLNLLTMFNFGIQNWCFVQDHVQDLWIVLV